MPNIGAIAVLAPAARGTHPRCRASGVPCGCAAEYYERTICVVCVTRLQRSWTIIHRPALPCGTVSPATKARIDSAWASMGTNVHAPRALRMLSSEVWCQSVMTSSQSAPSVIPMVLFHQRKANVARVQGSMRRGACDVMCPRLIRSMAVAGPRACKRP